VIDLYYWPTPPNGRKITPFLEESLDRSLGDAIAGPRLLPCRGAGSMRSPRVLPQCARTNAEPPRRRRPSSDDSRQILFGPNRGNSLPDV
jgi:hypothetical protein